MDRARADLLAQGLPITGSGQVASSLQRFDDGAAFRVEIPTVEGPDAFRAVLDAAHQYQVRIHRVSQGSGIMLQTDDEIRQMVALGTANEVEVCLFVGPRAGWDIGAQARSLSGALSAGSLRGNEQLVYAIEDVRHACDLGLRSVLVADLGLLSVLGRLRSSGELPADLVIKSSVFLPASNPATARVLQDLGASTLNLPVDLSIAQIASIREGVEAPVDIYIEGTDDFGGVVRHYEIPEIVRVAAPVYLKFSVRNAPNIYPSGLHLRELSIATARERVRRAAIGLALLARYQGSEA